jgi:hypothetical protein
MQAISPPNLAQTPNQDRPKSLDLSAFAIRKVFISPAVTIRTNDTQAAFVSGKTGE